MIPFSRTLAAAVAATVTCAGAQSLASGQKTLTAGNWTVIRTVNQMNDAVQCTGIWNDNYAIQLVPDRMFIRVSGGVRSVTVRYGDEPARPLRLASKMEEEIGSVILSGIDFDEFAKAGRLRLRVGTAVRGVAEFDIDAAGLEKAYQHMVSGCPSTSPPAAAKAAAGDCPTELVTRLRTAGVTDRQIRQACEAR